MTKKFLEIVKRQTVLATKAADGEATAEELVELQKLNKAIKAATDPVDQKVDTTLATMTLADFRIWHEKAVKSIEDGDADDALLAVVKRNLSAIKDQGKTNSEDIVAVEMPVEKSDSDRVADLTRRIAELEAKRDAEVEDDDTNGAEKGDKPTAQALAMEAIDTLLAKYNKLKALIDAGTFSKGDISSVFDGDWELKDIITDAAAIMAKAEEMKAAVEALMPELEKLDKAEGGEGDEGDGTGDGAEGDKTEGGESSEGDAEGGKGDAEGDKKPAEKGERSNWASGLDVAPRQTAEEQHQEIIARKEKFGY